MVPRKVVHHAVATDKSARNCRYNLQEWFALEKLLDKNEARNQIGKRVKRRICRPEQSRLGGQPNDRFIPEAVARRMFASLTLPSRRLS
jgi:hypothetical protein